MTEKKIPNSLTILINTKLPNYYKLNFDPSMSVPDTKSHTVYFDPLIKYNYSAINNLPRGAPKETLLTQFFEPNQFDSMMNRILSSFFTMQKQRTIEESTNLNIITHNIELTLKTLFKQNNILYLNNAPYTIVNMNWRQYDWEIDKKPLDKLLSQNAHLTPNQIEEQANKEKEALGVNLLSGAPVASGAIAAENNSIAINELQNIAAKSSEEPITGLTTNEDDFVPFIENKAVLESMDESFRRLYSKYLQKNNPINYDSVPDLIKDPLTFTLILDYDNLSNYIQTNNDTNTATLYNTIIDLKKKQNIEDKVYQDLCVKIAQFNKDFNDKMLQSHNKMLVLKRQQNNPKIDLTQANKIIDNMIELKTEFMQIYVKIAESLMNIYNLQNEYFTALKLLLERIKELLKTEYMKLIPYYEKPTLALKCVEYDINILNFLLVKDSSNPSSVSYFDNLSRFKTFYDSIIQTNKDTYLNPQINYDDEMQKYLYGDPSVILVEINQFQLYIYRILINYGYVQLDIWMLYLTTIRIFTGFIRDVYAEVDIDTSNKRITDYNSKYLNSDFLEKYKVNGLRAKPLIPNSNELKWYLVDSNGNACIPNEAAAMLQEKMYIDMIKSEVHTYDAIILFMYLTEISCLRRTKIIIAEENIQQLNLEYSNHLRNYLKSVFYLVNDYNSSSNINNSNNTLFLPPSINWDINTFIGTKNVDGTINTSAIEKQIETNERSNSLYLNKINVLQNKYKTITKYCNEYIDSLLKPSLSENGFIQFCEKIYENDIIDDKYIPSSSYWLQRELGNYDFTNTNNFNYLMMDITSEAYYDGIIDTRTPDGYINWIVVDNEGSGDCLFAAVRDALNGQLIVENATTINDYTETIDGIKQFTIQSLRRLVAENIDDTHYGRYCEAAGGQTVFQTEIKCRMNAVQKNNLQTNNPELYNILVDENGKIRTLYQFKQYIQEPRKFWGDAMCIEILQKILKIKFIIFEMFDEGMNQIRLGNRVTYNNQIYVVSSTNANESNLLHLDGTVGPQNISNNDLQLTSKNILKHLRIACNDFGQTETYSDYIFLVVTNMAEIGEPMVLHYELLKHSIIPDFIFKEDTIPIYIKYFIYNNCYQYLSNNARQNVGFQEFHNTFDEIEHQIETYKNRQIKTRIDKLTKKIRTYGKDLTRLQRANVINQTEEKEKQIKKLESRLRDFKEELNELTARFPNNYVGGALGFGNEYEQNQYAQYYGVQPQQTYGPQMYPFFNPFYQPLAGQPNYAFNTQQLQPNIYGSVAREKDQKSKLTYYVTIDLDLYPGSSANQLQKSAVLCHSRFEEIRKAFAEMFGYIYRPSVLGSTSQYDQQFKKKDDKDKKGGSNKNKRLNKTYRNSNRNKQTKTLRQRQ